MPSYSPVFSQDFINYNESDGDMAFEVPAGFTAVVRHADFSVEAGGSVFSLTKQNSGAAPTVQFFVATLVGLLEHQQWDGRVVIPEGGILTLYQATLGVAAQVYAGGYLLRNTLT